jgi:hypothetical protein
MKTRYRWSLAMLLACAVLCLTPIEVARGDTSPKSRVEHAGLIVEFSSQCANDAVELHGSITNETTQPITVKSGSVPWQYDVLGSEFVADASGRKLKRDWTAPILGRVGPITLAAHERQVGVVPISTLFPQLRAALEKGPVVIHWRYWTDAKTVRRGLFAGTLVISVDPCGDAH